MTLASHMRGLPDNFKRYFYDYKLIVQVYLNDTALFDAAISLKENSEIRLIRIVDTSFQDNDIDPEIKARWAYIIKQGFCMSLHPTLPFWVDGGGILPG
ncbi:hypothetical protein [Candidatus Williamhamiltonella defendens]|uniref:hypothetical protein n=1 Tax=Candidatus Williamhamiltonella defendens TaxID=138072 RepID=UPI00130DDDD0|nr:hypothetical protein [Candidatus Hamiltonella defensa]